MSPRCCFVLIASTASLAAALLTLAQSSATLSPTTAPSGQEFPFSVLLPTPRAKAPPLLPLPDAPVFDETTQTMIPPRPPEVSLIPEGTVKLNRIGHLARNADGKPEFTFGVEPDVQADAPMLVLPNRLLAAMEQRLQEDPNLWFRVSYRITQYYPRNYMLIDAATPTTQPTTQSTTYPTSLPTLAP